MRKIAKKQKKSQKENLKKSQKQKKSRNASLRWLCVKSQNAKKIAKANCNKSGRLTCGPRIRPLPSSSQRTVWTCPTSESTGSYSRKKRRKNVANIERIKRGVGWVGGRGRYGRRTESRNKKVANNVAKKRMLNLESWTAAKKVNKMILNTQLN